VRFLLSRQITHLDAATGGVWKGTIAGDGTVTFVDGGGDTIGATSIVQFYNSTLAYAAVTGQNIIKCTVNGSGDLGTCSEAAAYVPAFGGLVIGETFVYLCK